MFSQATQTNSRLIKFTKYGLGENLIHAHIVMKLNGQERLGEVTGFYFREFPQATMLKVRHFNGEPMTDVAASAVRILIRD